MSYIAVIAYKPFPGFDTGFKEVLKDHTHALREEGFITDKPVYQMQSLDGTVIEVFEWVSSEAKKEAHNHPRIMEIWNRFYEYAQMVKLMDVLECHEPFASFTSIDVEAY